MYVLAPNQVLETYPYSIGDLRRDNRSTSFPRNPSEELLAEWDVYPVVTQPQPTFNARTERVEPVEPKLIDGVWTIRWAVLALPQEQIQAAQEAELENARAIRNAKLAASDWTQLADAPVDSAAWAVYRQALRDVTDQEGFPTDINWPVEPS